MIHALAVPERNIRNVAELMLNMKKIKPKQILAIIAVVLLVSMYVVSLILAFFHSEFATKLLLLSIVMTILVPVVLYIIMMFYKLNNREK